VWADTQNAFSSINQFPRSNGTEGIALQQNKTTAAWLGRDGSFSKGTKAETSLGRPATDACPGTTSFPVPMVLRVLAYNKIKQQLHG
jgi:hypothetical protein